MHDHAGGGWLVEVSGGIVSIADPKATISLIEGGERGMELIGLDGGGQSCSWGRSCRKDLLGGRMGERSIPDRRARWN